MCQRYKFKSKSQQSLHGYYIDRSVFDVSKIQIQKQITTMAQFEAMEKKCV